MKKTMKKTGLLCCVLLCVAGLATAQTEADFELAPDNRVVLGTTGSRMDGTYNYVTVAAGNGVVIAKYKGNRNNSTIVIPATIGGRPVVGIDWQAFSGLRMTSVTIPEGVTSIGQSAFSSCESLRSVTIPSSVTAVGYGAFHYCSLTSVTISEGVTSLGVAMFTLSRLTSVAIPASVTSIGDRAFNDINTLTSITVSPANQQYKDIDGVLFTKDGKTLVAYPGGRKGAYTVPAGVTAIGENAFASCKELTSVTLSASLATIGKQAFHYSVLKSVTIPAGVTAVSGDAFSGNRTLASITVSPANQQYKDIDGVLFTKDGKTLVAYPGGGKTAYTIPAGVTAIGERAFETRWNMTSVTIPAGVTTIGEGAFDGCSDLVIKAIPAGVTTIGARAFHRCDLPSVTIPSSVTSVGKGAFSSTDLEDNPEIRADIERRFGKAPFEYY